MIDTGGASLFYIARGFVNLLISVLCIFVRVKCLVCQNMKPAVPYSLKQQYMNSSETGCQCALPKNKLTVEEWSNINLNGFIFMYVITLQCFLRFEVLTEAFLKIQISCGMMLCHQVSGSLHSFETSGITHEVTQDLIQENLNSPQCIFVTHLHVLQDYNAWRYKLAMGYKEVNKKE